MSVFGFNEATAVVAWGVFTFVQLTTARHRKWYDDKAPAWFPPPWVFGLVWPILYAACTTAIFYHVQIAAADSWQLVVGVVLYIVHMLANKLWSVLFWDWRRPGAALATLVIMILTLIGLIVSSAMLPSGTLFWVPVMLESVYMVWLVFATVMNGYWLTL